MKDKEKIQISGKQTKVGKSLTMYAKDNVSNTLKSIFPILYPQMFCSLRINLILNVKLICILIHLFLLKEML